MPDIEFSTKGAEKVVAAHEAIIKATDKTKQNYKLTADEAKNLGRIERQVYRDTETAIEQYNRKLSDARKALAGNVDEVERLQRYEKQLATQYATTASEAEKAALKGKVAAGKATEQEKQLLATVKETEQSLANSGNVFSAAFSPTKIAGVVAGFVGVQQVVSAITRELQAQQEMIDKKNATQLSVGESRNVLLRNLVGSSDAEIKQTLGASQSIASDTGVSEVAINNAMAKAISATGGNLNLSQALVRHAAKYLPDQPANIGDFAGTLGDLTRVTKSTDPTIALGLLSQVGKLGHISDQRALAQSVGPALIGTLPFGGDASTSGALFAALTSGGGDTHGDTTGTALIALAQQLDDASQGKLKGFEAGELKGGNLLERIRALQANPALATKFLDSASFEKKTVGPITQLLTDAKSGVRTDFENALKSLPDEAGLRKAGNEALGIFRYNTLEPTAARGRALQSGLEQLQTRRASGRLSSQELEAIRGQLMETGSTDTGARFGELVGRVKGGGTVKATEAENILRYRIDELEHPTIHMSGVGDGDWGSTVERPATEAEKENARILRGILQQLEKSNEQLGNISNKEGGMLAGAE